MNRIIKLATSCLQRRWLPALLLVLAVGLAYLPVWHGGYIWDDDQHLTQNPCIVGPLGFKGIWTTNSAIYYPLVLTSFWVQHALWGLSPAPYHLVNILMHGACAVLLWRVLLALRVRGAWLGAALWALHPVQVESVAWITELKNTQSAAFFLLSVLVFLRWHKGGGGNPGYYALSLLCAAAAILSKSSTVMLPVVLGMCWWWVGSEGCGPLKWLRQNWRGLLWLAPFFLISAAAAGWTIWEEKFVSGAIGAEWAQSWPDRCIIAGKAVWFYLFKLLWPEPLILIYPRWHIDGSKPAEYLPVVAAVAWLLILWQSRKSWARPALLASGYFVISLFPVLGFFSVAYFAHSFVADHFQYLASMGPLALAGSGITLAMEFYGLKTTGRMAVCGGLLAALMVLTWRQSAPYADARTLYERTLEKNPDSWMAHNNLGNLVLQKGEVDRALAEFRAALAIRPDYAEAHNNLGNTLFQQGHLDEAFPHLQRALEIKPAFPDADNNLGNALMQMGRVDEAIDRYQNALQANPNLALAHSGLGVALAQKGRMEEARGHFVRAAEIQPDSVDAHFNLANLCLQTGRVEETVHHLQRVLEIRPGMPVAQNMLAWILATWPDAAIRNGPKALALAEELARTSAGRDAVILDTLAAAQAECGKFSDALETARRAANLARTQGNAALTEEIRARVKLYEALTPFHQSMPTGP